MNTIRFSDKQLSIVKELLHRHYVDITTSYNAVDNSEESDTYMALLAIRLEEARQEYSELAATATPHFMPDFDEWVWEYHSIDREELRQLSSY